MAKSKIRETRAAETSWYGRTRLATNLRKVREAQGLSQEKLAEQAGFHRTFVSQVEREKNNISIDNIQKLAEALDVDILELLVRPK